MEESNVKNCPRAGPIDDGESRTASSDAVWPMYTGGATIARRSEEAVDTAREETEKVKKSAAVTSEAQVPAIKAVQKMKTRSATPVPGGSRFYGTDGGTSDEYMSGADTAVSCSRGEDTEKEDKARKERTRRAFLKRRGSLSPEEREKDVIRKPLVKRGRGRPPTTGEYVGLAKARREALEAEREALRIEAECEIMGETRKLQQTRSRALSVSSSDATMAGDDEVTAATLGANIAKGLASITKVAKTSGNLSGTYIKSLKEAASLIQESCAALLLRSTSEETRALQRANTRLSTELVELKSELVAVKRELLNVQIQAAPPTAGAGGQGLSMEEMLKGAVREAVSLSSARLDARLETLEARLLLELRLRPPLAADKRRAQEAAVPATQAKLPSQKTPRPEPSVSTLIPPTNPGPPLKKGKKVKRQSAAAKEAAAARSDAAPNNAASLPAATSEWTQVVKGGRNKRRRVEEEKPGTKGRNRQRKERRLRAPRSAAVVLTLKPEAEQRGVSYKDVLAKAKQRVDLHALDIPAVRFKIAVTGARMLEIPGASSRDKADQLAQKLREVMEEEDIRISRPQKCAELRIEGLDDSANKEEIVQAIVRSGGCAPGDVKVGEIRTERRGRGTAWIKCPVEAAKKVVRMGLYVGWTMVRVTLLSARPMRCFRCLETGHVSATCQSEVNRSELCFRCGQEGHAAAQCANEPRCALCTAHGRPADHVVGTKPCPKSTPKKMNGPRRSQAPAKAASTSTAASSERAESMDAT